MSRSCLRRVSACFGVGPVFLLGLNLLGGCAPHAQFSAFQAEDTVTVGDAQGQSVELARQALLDLGFEIDQFDPRLGVVTTQLQPIPQQVDTAQWSSTTSGQLLEGVLSGLHRSASVSCSDEGVDVAVFLYRPHQISRQITHASAQRRVAAMDGGPTEWRDAPKPTAWWEPVGRDVRLEAKLLGRLQADVQETG